MVTSLNWHLTLVFDRMINRLKDDIKVKVTSKVITETHFYVNLIKSSYILNRMQLPSDMGIFKLLLQEIFFNFCLATEAYQGKTLKPSRSHCHDYQPMWQMAEVTDVFINNNKTNYETHFVPNKKFWQLLDFHLFHRVDSGF